MILITGGAGYIGSHAAMVALEAGETVAIVDSLVRGWKELVDELTKKYGEEKVKFYQIDLKNREEIERVMEEVKPTGVMHFGALCLVNESMEKPELYFENNVGGTLNLLVAMEKAGVKNLVFSSTCAVYGETQYLPVDEKHATNPVNPYGESKLLAEKEIKWFGALKGINYVIFRYFNVAGAADDGSIGDSKKPSQLLMQNAVRGALGIEPFSLTCPSVPTRDGTPVRDYIHVVDLAGAHVKALKYLADGGSSEIINLGTGKGNTVLEIVEAVKKGTGVDFEVGKAEPRKGEYAEIYANNTKAKEVLGWEPQRGIDKAVESLVTWYKNRPQGWSY
jgi:UDP-glucose 4-epimerase